MSEEIDDRSTEVRTYFVRGRNALVARADLSKIYIDYFLHLADFGLVVSAEDAEYAKSALAAVTLHCASRPRNERVAWTVNFQRPLLNVFAAGDSPLGTVVANVFSDGVRVAPFRHHRHGRDVAGVDVLSQCVFYDPVNAGHCRLSGAKCRLFIPQVKPGRNR